MSDFQDSVSVKQAWRSMFGLVMLPADHIHEREVWVNQAQVDSIG